MIATTIEGEPHAPTAYVFGDRLGRKVGSPKKAWAATVLRSYGYHPIWRKDAGTLSAESLAQLAAIDLNFHDLRHEAGSRWADAGWPLHHIQANLGHADLSTTSIYLNADLRLRQESMRRFGNQPLQTVANSVQKDHQALCNEPAENQPQIVVN
jgi:integrase